MKKIFIFLIALVTIPMLSHATFEVTGRSEQGVTGNICNEAGLTYNKSYGVSPGEFSGKKITAIVTYSSVTYADVVFTTASYTAGSGEIAIPSHGLTRALPVLLRATSGTIPPPLVAETTYYAIPITANIIELATTSAKAQAGSYIVMGSSKPAIATQTYTLIVPTTIVGTPSFKWQASNDGVKIVDLDIQAISITEYTVGGATVGFDFNDFNYTTLIMNVTSPTTGGLNIKSQINMKP